MRLFGSDRQVIRQNTSHRRPFPAVWLSFCALLTVPVAEAATESAQAPENTAAQQLVDSPLRRLPDYSNASDHELTRIGAQWDDLTKDEKDALLREVKMRMAQRKDRDGVLMIRTQRRYGRVYGGGQYLKIETKVVRITPKDPAEADAGRGFGVGFEQRTAEGASPADSDPDGQADEARVGASPGADVENTTFQSPVSRVTEVSQ